MPIEEEEHDIQVAETFLERYYKDEVVAVWSAPREHESIAIDWMDMWRFDTDFAEQYFYHPADVRQLLEDALLRIDAPVDAEFSPTNTRVRIYNIDDGRRFHIGRYRPEHVSEVVAVRGQVSQRTGAKMRLETAVYTCQRCGTATEIPQTGTDETTPAGCGGCERQGPFRRDEELSTRSRYQALRLTPPPERGAAGSEYLDVTLSGDLVNCVDGGERVEITGVLHPINESDGSAIQRYELDANHVNVIEGNASDIDIEEHRDTIEHIAAAPDPIEELKASFAPHLAREEGGALDALIEATILQMVGSPSAGGYRDYLHVLALGDPGTAKTEVLEEAEQLAPRAKFKSGRSVSATGLTASAVPDDFGGSQWSLKAGLLPMANGGLACLDEIDKVPREAIMSIHSALENGRVSVSKAGMDADMPAETSLLAAGNPKDGRFDEYEAISEQIDFPASLLSRFDLKFMLKDKPDEERDKRVSEHLAESFVAATKADDGEGTDRPIPAEAIRAYVAHARESVAPVVEDMDEVVAIATDHYQDIRADVDEDDPVPTTPRNLEAVLRLAHASARARLSDTVERSDVKRAQALVMRSLAQMAMDPETGELDVDFVETGTSKSQRDRKRTIKGIIRELQEEYDGTAPVDDVLDRAEAANFERSKAEYDIEKLRRQGDAYEPQTGEIQLV